MKSMTPALDKSLGSVLWGGVVVGQGLLGASYLGKVGMNLGFGEALLWLGGGLILLTESVVENGKDLAKLKPFPVLSFLGGAAATVFGAGLALEMTGVTAVFFPYKTPLLAAVLVLEVLEARLKG